MATFYLDPEGGNDANNGTTFANRWKTLTSGATAARIAPGDVIRIMATHPAGSIGNATWTNNSRTLTLATARTLNIWKGDEAWTAASANITISTSTTRKLGTVSARMVAGDSFTTGKMCYKTLSAPVDASAYEQIFCWIYTSSSALANVCELRLCSDTTGDTAVHTIPFSTFGSTTWFVANFDNGAALSSNINSVSLWATSDPGTVELFVQNIIACGPSDAADTFSLLSVIGKTADQRFFTVDTIDGTTVTLVGGKTTTTASTALKYYGTTETVDTSVWNPLNTCLHTGGNTASNVLQDTGTITNPIELSGGWNRTDMSTQTGETFWGAGYCKEYTFSIPSRRSTTIRKMSFAHADQQAAYFDLFGTGITKWIESTGAFGSGRNSAAPVLVTSIYRGARFQASLAQVTSSAGALFTTTGILNSISAKIDYLAAAGGTALFFNSTTYGEIAAEGVEINGCAYGVYDFSTNYSGRNLVVKGYAISNSATADVRQYEPSQLPVVLVDCSTLSSTPTFNNGDMVSLPYRFYRYGKTANDHRMIGPRATVRTDSTVTQSGSGVSWRASYNTALTDFLVWIEAPLTFPLARIACNGGATVTVTCYVRKAHASLVGGIRVVGGQFMGVNSTVSATISVGVDTWEQLTITFTPSEATVVEVEGWMYGIGAQNFYWDTFSVSQA